MEKMRKQGVKRAAIEVQASYRKGWVEDVHIVRRLYFSQFDGPDSQISSASILKRIDDSGLQTELDRAVIDRAKVAPVKGPVDSPPLSFRHRFHYVWTLVQIYSDPAFPQEKTLLHPTGHQTATLNDAVLFGDALETQKLLQAKRFKQGELDYTLFSAVMSDFDNTTSIRLLLGAGANANSRAGDETTPLMVAVARPCNIRPLLDGGADRDARDSSGRTAIEIARQQRVIVSVQLLEQAGAR